MKIFISHSMKDTAFVSTLSDKINLSKNAECFDILRTVEYGEDIGMQVMKCIDECDCFIALLTKSGLDSWWVHQETGYAIAKKKPIIPIIDDLTKTPGLLHRNIKAIVIDPSKLDSAFLIVEKVLEYLQRHKKEQIELLINIALEKVNRHLYFDAAGLYSDIADRYKIGNDIFNAIKSLNTAASLYKEESEYWEIGMCYLSIASIYHDQNSIPNEIKYLVHAANSFIQDDELYEAAEGYRKAADLEFDRNIKIEYYQTARELFVKEQKSEHKIQQIDNKLHNMQ